MRAYQVIKFGQKFEKREIEKPKPSEHEVLARTVASGVCHTDLHVAHGDLGLVDLPVTGGHEGVGIIEEVGSKVTKFKVGDRIGVPWLGLTCLDCVQCHNSLYNICQNQYQTGFKRNGSFAEYFVADERFAAKIPDSLESTAAAPILCAGLTSYRALKILKSNKSIADTTTNGGKKRIVISGAGGGLGHLGVQYAKLMDLEVIALDVLSEDKYNLLKKLGVDHVVNIKDKNYLEQLEEIEKKHGTISGAVIFAPAPNAYQDAVKYVSPGGVIVAVSLLGQHVELDTNEIILKDLSLKGSIVGNPEDLQEVLNLSAQGKIHAECKIEPHENLPKIIDDLEHGTIRGRVVLTF